MTVRELVDGEFNFDVEFRIFCWYVSRKDDEAYGDFVGNDQDIPQQYMDLDITDIHMGEDGILVIECVEFIEDQIEEEED